MTPKVSITPRHAALCILMCIALVPALASAQFDARDPGSVGVAFLPFGVEYSEDRVLAAAIEKALDNHLRRRIGHPVYTSKQVSQALEDGVAGCLADRYCIPFMGDQFNVSLVVHTEMSKLGEELNLDVDFYATGNGLRIAAKSGKVRIGDDGAAVDLFSGWIKELFDASLLVNAESLAGKGGVIGGAAGEEERLAADLKASRRKENSSRREDFSSMREAEVGFDRTDPTADLRSIAAGGEGLVESPSQPRERRRSENGRSESRSNREQRTQDGDFDLDSLDDEPPRRARPGSSSRDRSKRRSEKPLSLDARQSGGRSVASYSEAQRAGLGPRDYKRFTRTGLTMEGFLDRRWAHGRRFHVRVGGSYGLGWLTRRYATIIYIPATGQKTEEYAWESLGFSAINPGFSFGVGYAPVDFLEIEFDVSVMLAQQDLRNEYIWQGAAVPTNKGAPPRSQRTGHVLADLRARFFVNPMGRVKFAPGLGVTMLVMGGYQIADEGPVQYSSRPTAGLVGLTPVVGMTAALSPFLSLYVDVLPTILLTRGAAKFEELAFSNGETERTGLTDSDLNPPLEGCGGSDGEGFSSCPLVFRLSVGTMIMF